MVGILIDAVQQQAGLCCWVSAEGAVGLNQTIADRIHPMVQQLQALQCQYRFRIESPGRSVLRTQGIRQDQSQQG